MKIDNKSSQKAQSNLPSPQTIIKVSAILVATSMVALKALNFGIDYLVNYQQEEFERQVGYIFCCCDKGPKKFPSKYGTNLALAIDKLAWIMGYFPQDLCLPQCLEFN